MRVAGLRVVDRAVKQAAQSPESQFLLASDGSVWAWGGGGNEAVLGTGSGASYQTPEQVKGLPSDIVDIANMSHGTFYLYFANMSDLVRALTIEAATDASELYGALTEAGTAQPRSSPLPRDRSSPQSDTCPH